MKPKQAAKIQVGCCDCPSLHVNLFDRQGRIFASACMPVETGKALAADILNSIAVAEANQAGGIGPCQGHA